MRLKDTVALVTGASRRIAAAVAQAYAGDGARVILTYLGNAAPAAQVVDRIGVAGGQASSVHGDVAHAEDLAAFLAQRQCLPRRGTPADMVGAVVYLASHESDVVTGQVVTVDGGGVHE
jgi:NAD(P)-dependent dehydrogenase (short-subunit alcohol dehydrogenase family)